MLIGDDLKYNLFKAKCGVGVDDEAKVYNGAFYVGKGGNPSLRAGQMAFSPAITAEGHL